MLKHFAPDVTYALSLCAFYLALFATKLFKNVAISKLLKLTVLTQFLVNPLIY